MPATPDGSLPPHAPAICSSKDSTCQALIHHQRGGVKAVTRGVPLCLS
jgi:hypothetical protein